jgi:hypothetical protein
VNNGLDDLSSVPIHSWDLDYEALIKINFWLGF